MFQHSPHDHDSSAAFQSGPSHQECNWLPRGGGERSFLANQKQVDYLAAENVSIELDDYLGICSPDLPSMSTMMTNLMQST